MQRWIKIGATVVGAGAASLAGVLLVGAQRAAARRERTVEVSARAVPEAADDEAGRARGRYLYASRGCADCHGADGGGQTFAQGDGMHVAGPNITRGGVTARYGAQDWDRIVRHGVKPDGRPAFMMPSEDYARLTDADLGALVAHVQRLEPRAGGEAIMELPLPVVVLYGLGVIEDAAEKIDHSLPPPAPIAAAVTPAHGEYVAHMCKGCHGPGLSGGPIPGGPPDWPAAANLTSGPGSAMTRYPTPEAFLSMLRSGTRPDGTPIKGMPFPSLRELDEVDVRAVYAYLGTVPARDAGQR